MTYPALYLADLTILSPTIGFVARKYRLFRFPHVRDDRHVLHAGLGVLDAWFVVTGQVPAPAYSMPYFLGGVAVGAGALPCMSSQF